MELGFIQLCRYLTYKHKITWEFSQKTDDTRHPLEQLIFSIVFAILASYVNWWLVAQLMLVSALQIIGDGGASESSNDLKFIYCNTCRYTNTQQLAKIAEWGISDQYQVPITHVYLNLSESLACLLTVKGPLGNWMIGVGTETVFITSICLWIMRVRDW